MNRKHIRRKWVGVVAAAVVSASSIVRAHSWVNPAGGSFHNVNNWNPVAVPGSVDQAIFNLGAPGYVVNMTSNITNQRLIVQNDTVTLGLGSGVIYTLTLTDGVNVAIASGQEGTLSLTGGTVSASSARIGNLSGSNGQLTIGFNNTFNMSNVLNVGTSGGTGVMNILNGGDASTPFCFVGSGSGSNGTVDVSNTGSTLTVNSNFDIGDGARGTLIVENGADVVASTVSGSSTTIGSVAGSIGTVTVRDFGSTMTNSNTLYVGREGSGTLNVQTGGDYASGIAYIGYMAGSNGNATVTGVNSSWVASSSIAVALEGTGSLTVSNGAIVSATGGTIGSNDTASGIALVTGTGSRWDNTSNMFVGASGVGSLTIQNGGAASCLNLNIGSNTGGRGTLTLSGASSLLDVDVSMFVGGTSGGAGGTGTLNVNAGTTASIGSLLRVWPAGTVNLTGGTLNIGSLTMSGGIFNFSSGTLNIASGPFNVGTATGPFGYTVQLDADQHVTASNVFVDVGALLIINGGSIGATNPANIFGNNGEIRMLGGTSLISGRPLTNSGILTGSGLITAATFTNSAAGELRVLGSDRMVITSPATNNGTINFLNGGTAEFQNTLTNSSTGKINGRGILIARGGATNQGQMTFSGGFTDFFGNLINQNGSKIFVTGQGVTTFYNPITHNAGANINVSVGSMAVFMGDVTGTGTFSGGGIKVFESTGTVIGPVATPGSTVVEPAAAVTAGYFREDSLTVGGAATIATDGGTSHLNSLNIDSGGVLDLKNNSLVLENGDLQAITTQIRSGLNTGIGIVSTAPGNPFRLGSMSNAGTIYSSFQGISGLNGDEVLIRYTRIGDLNLDGTVTISDFIDLASNFNHIGGSTWQMGDVNYDGSVTISDFIDLASNFNQSVSGDALPISEDDAAMLADFAAQHGASAVPEPHLFSVLSLGLLFLRRARRR